ncbi:MAG: helix-turn-helix domain-containing protein [Bacteroidia bacterium]
MKLNQARLFFEQEKFATVTEVMFACGFKSSGHFSKSYFERFGKKPSEYFD